MNGSCFLMTISLLVKRILKVVQYLKKIADSLKRWQGCARRY